VKRDSALSTLRARGAITGNRQERDTDGNPRPAGSRDWADRQGLFSLGFETVCKAACIATRQAVKNSKIRGKVRTNAFGMGQ
jgi:hypothetical protein